MNQIGLKKEEIDTPALLVDLDLMEENMSTMANFFKDKEARLRPHTKVHRTPMLARKQLEAGAKGICCQKVGEAEVMAAAGIKDIMVTNQIVTQAKIDRLVALSKNAQISVPVDSFSNAESLSKTVQSQDSQLNVLVDVHLGSNRCGVEPGPAAVKLARSIEGLNGLRLVGLMGFEGHISWMEPRDKRRSEIERLEGVLVDTKKLIERSGIDVPEISTGSTGTYDVSASIPGVTEVQAGTYLLMEPGYHEHVPEFKCALSVLSTVISKPSDERVITDAGIMSMSSVFGNPKVVGIDGVEVYRVDAENSILRLARPAGIHAGDRVEFLPSYLDATVSRHNTLYGLRNGKIESIWDIAGKGTSS